MEELHIQAKQYFSQTGFKRVFQGFAKQYISFEKIGGKITISNLSEDEKETLEGFFQKDFHHQKTLQITAEGFRKALRKTKFSEISLEEIFDLVYTDNLLSKKQQIRLAKEKWEESFKQIMAEIPEGKASNWFLWEQLEETNVFRKMRQDEKENAPKFISDMILVLRALEHLPVWNHDFMSLPVFSARVTGNPHTFDDKNSITYYLLHGIRSLRALDISPDTSENRKEILRSAGILTDGISNFVTCCGITGYLDDGTEHPGMKGFVERGEEIQININLICKFKKVSAISNFILIVENPAVFDALHATSVGKLAMICGNGQIRAATLWLLDLLKENGHEFAYCGDFDPEGLLIAQRLKNRLGDSLFFWHYHNSDYEMAKSMQPIANHRLKQLEQITDPSLLTIADILKKEKTAGYQENLIDIYIDSLTKNEGVI